MNADFPYTRYVMPEPNSGCWLWTACVNHHGYGRIRRSAEGVGRDAKAHRFSWEWHNGKIPDGMQVLHKCDVRSCVNPDHLYIGTPKQNTADMMSRNRGVFVRGEAAGRARITELQARTIFGDARSYEKIAKEYGIGASTVRAIKTRKSWKHIH